MRCEIQWALGVVLTMGMATDLARGQQVDAFEESTLFGSGAENLDGFGYNVAVSGDRALVGCTELSFPDFTPGSAYVFVRDARGHWTEEARLQPSDGIADPPTSFGWSVDLDGNLAVVGGPGQAGTGSAYLYERGPNGWEEVAILEAPVGELGARFGQAVSVKGGAVLIGAPAMDPFGPGRAFVYERSAAGWSLVAQLEAGAGQLDDRFGAAVSLDRTHLVVGSPTLESWGPQGGALWVYEREPNGWQLDQQLTLPGSPWFGGRAVLERDRLMVSSSAGIHTYERTGSAWTLLQTLTESSDGGPLGSSFDFDGDRAVIGAPTQGTGGRAVVFHWDGSGWDEAAVLDGSAVDTLDGFGEDVALSGSNVVVGAPLGAAPTGPFVGGAYGFRISSALSLPDFCVGAPFLTPCPCDNYPANSMFSGCANSTGEGGRLFAYGTASRAADDLVIRAQGLPDQVAVLYGGDTLLGVPFGDGLLCAGGSVARFDVRSPGQELRWGTGLLSGAGWRPGDLLFLQVWYRDPGGPCGSGVNASSALILTVMP